MSLSIQDLRDALRNTPLWEQMFDHNPAVQLLIDPAGSVIIDANPAACRFYGYPREVMRGLTLEAIEVRDDAGVIPEGDTSRFDHEHQLSSGAVRLVRVSGTPLHINGMSVTHLIVFDITERRRAEAAAVGQRALNSALIATAAALVDTLDLPEVLDRILTQVQHILPNEYINVMLIEGEYAVVKRARGYERVTDYETYRATQLDIYETRTLRWMMDHHQPLVVADVDSDPIWQPTSNTTPWLKSYLGAPIRMGGMVIGFLNFDSSQPDRFRNFDAASLQAFADQAGVAIRNARLFERVRRQANMMEVQAAEAGTQLEIERRQLRVILDSMTEAVIYSEIDSDGAFHPRYVNRAMMHMLGFPDGRSDDPDTQHNAIQRLEIVFYPGVDRDELRQATLNVLRRGGVFQRALSYQTPDGIHTEFQLTISRVDDADGRLAGAVTVLRDVSEARALERQRSRFLARASHELRTPITNLKTRLYLLRRQADRLPQDLPVLEQVTAQMSKLVETLLELSRLERGDVQMQRRVLHMQQLVADAAEAHRPNIEGRGQTLTLHLNETPIVLQGDPDRLTQVINNLLANASTYTPQGGTISVRLSQQGEATMPYVCLEVLDDGIGIPEDQLEDIFKPFHRVNEGGDGVGLGLSITREIVHLHNGSISVQSKPGKGSRFIVMLPIPPIL
jgi:PAS domain S-box-containing protein